jgi:hypothetical protein
MPCNKIREQNPAVQPRNLLDLYIPYRHWLRLGPSPVVVFVTGGAWTIGYKAWGALFARRLSQLGIIVVSIDYRNFPQVRSRTALALWFLHEMLPSCFVTTLHCFALDTSHMLTKSQVTSRSAPDSLTSPVCVTAQVQFQVTLSAACS